MSLPVAFVDNVDNFVNININRLFYGLFNILPVDVIHVI